MQSYGPVRLKSEASAVTRKYFGMGSGQRNEGFRCGWHAGVIHKHTRARHQRFSPHNAPFIETTPRGNISHTDISLIVEK